MHEWVKCADNGCGSGALGELGGSSKAIMTLGALYGAWDGREEVAWAGAASGFCSREESL